MAKDIKKVNKENESDDIVIISEELQEKVKDTKNNVDEVVTIDVDLKPEDDVVVLQEVEESPTPEKMVKVKLKNNHRCHIGGSWYVFKKGLQYHVPETVKQILNKAGMLEAL